MLTPAVTGLSAASGSTAGGMNLVINGSGFAAGDEVLLGGTAVTPSINSTSQMSIVTPANAAGTVDVQVCSTVDGNSDLLPADQFTYIAPPGVTGLSASGGTTSGGNSVTIFGDQLSSVTSVMFGAIPSASFVLNNDGTITAISPAESSGTVDITVANGSVTSVTSPSDQFTFAGMPTVTGLSTTSGSMFGGTSVTITGTNLSSVSNVMFGSNPAGSVTVNSDTSITVSAPNEWWPGTVDVTVSNAAGTSVTSSVDRYTYQSPAPTVTGLSTSSGPTTGGTSLSIFGTNLDTVNQVVMNGVTVPFMVDSSSQITIITPSMGPGTVDIQVYNWYGFSSITSADQFTYVTPLDVTGLSVSGGSTSGANSVTIFGDQLSTVTSVMFGSVPAASFVLNGDGTITAVSPAESSRTVDITVTNGSATSATSTSDQFTFVAPPSITGLSTSSGPSFGGTSVTIIGTSLSSVTNVMFGSNSVGSITVNSDTSITVDAPNAWWSGTVDVTVSNAGGTSATSSADQYTYLSPVPTSLACQHRVVQRRVGRLWKSLARTSTVWDKS